MSTDYFAHSATETGYNHIKMGKVCEDSSGYYDDEKMHICVVADGHGSDNYPRTDRGSRYAVDVTIECIREFVQLVDSDEMLIEKYQQSILNQLSKSILNRWYAKVEEDYRVSPFTVEELEKVSNKYKDFYLSGKRVEKAYGSTLIAFAVTDQFSFGIQIGDGKCVMVDQEGKWLNPIPEDDNCQLNVTTSICDNNAIEEFRYCVLTQNPCAVFLGTDGVDDSYVNTDELYAFYRSILEIFSEYGNEVGKNEIKEYLPVLTKKGSGDDVSIAMIIDQLQNNLLRPVFLIQSEVFNKESELENRKRQLLKRTEYLESVLNQIKSHLSDEQENQEFYSELERVTAQISENRKSIVENKKEIAELKEKLRTYTNKKIDTTITDTNSLPVKNACEEAVEVSSVEEHVSQINTECTPQAQSYRRKRQTASDMVETKAADMSANETDSDKRNCQDVENHSEAVSAEEISRTQQVCN